jgi:hypothetical protein
LPSLADQFPGDSGNSTILDLNKYGDTFIVPERPGFLTSSSSLFLTRLFKDDRIYRADIKTPAAADTALGINPGNPVSHVDDTDRTFSDAELAADALIGNNFGDFST